MAKGNKNNTGAKEKSGGNAKYILIAVILLIAGYFIYTNVIDKGEETKYTFSADPNERIKNIKEPQFKKQGDLDFLDKEGKNVIKKIDIELAENDDQRMQGLMYRRSMDEARGMLFVFQQEEPQSFWMKNTVIPLDIIYVNSKREIVKIFKSTTPFSEKSLPSEKPATYVVEVNGGFTDKYNIKEGDMIRYSRQ